MANTKIFTFAEDINNLEGKNDEDRKKLQENIEPLDKWSRIWQIPKYLYLLKT